MAVGAALGVVAVLWWRAHAPVSEIDRALGGLITGEGTDGYDGALAMPIIVASAITGLTAAWATTSRRRGLAAAALIGVVVVGALLIGASIERMVGEIRMIPVEDLAGVPFAPAGIGAWAAVAMPGTALVSAAAVQARKRENAVALTLVLIAGFGFLAFDLARTSDGAGNGVAVIAAAAGAWLTAGVWLLRCGSSRGERQPLNAPSSVRS